MLLNETPTGEILVFWVHWKLMSPIGLDIGKHVSHLFYMGRL